MATIYRGKSFCMALSNYQLSVEVQMYYFYSVLIFIAAVY